MPPLSPALIKRMTSIVNAELLGVLSIPFVATLMARGVLRGRVPVVRGGAAGCRMCGLFDTVRDGGRWTGPTTGLVPSLLRSRRRRSVSWTRGVGVRRPADRRMPVGV